mmetsp:Transcript_18838/g.51619  ORF Transcript_18838/g.51619 Transcript_18838/m.51619 type:complete len:117 (-) Transcript_18838:433-783(-)
MRRTGSAVCCSSSSCVPLGWSFLRASLLHLVVMLAAAEAYLIPWTVRGTASRITSQCGWSRRLCRPLSSTGNIEQEKDVVKGVETLESDNNNNNETTKQQQHPSVLILPRLPGSVQ